MPLTKPSIENDALMARYPFLPQGSDFLKIVLLNNGITVDDLIEEPWLEEVRARGRSVSYTHLTLPTIYSV